VSLAAGIRLGPYEILAPLGAGGMGEVYRARDSRLDRIVAVKVLPAHLSGDEHRRQRFEREARTISQLSHPHICSLYDIGRQDGTDYLVMEYIEGETLTQRLAKGPLPAEQYLRSGIQIADALDRAHRQGIVHRDLKPGNIMLAKSGVKLLDFGLAKFAASPAAINLSALPTEADRQLTDTGQILGTLQYMSPEQLEGKEADVRSDLFAFGAVLYEMATGNKAFTGKNQASLIAAILQNEPQPISSVSPLSPPALDRVVRTCLAKDPEDRWQTAHDVMLQLRWIAEGGSQAGIPAPVAAGRRGREARAWSVAAALLVAAAIFAGAYWRSRTAAPPALHFSVLPPEGKTFAFESAPIAISSDGMRLVFSAQEGDRTHLYVRSLASFEARPLEGTDDVQYPFWSPDGAWVGFFQGGKLKKIRAGGGPAEAIAEAPNCRGGSWGRDGAIVFAPLGGGAIYRVSEMGGTATPVTFPRASEEALSHRFPSFLPDGRHFLYLAMKSEESEKVRDEELGIFIGSTESREAVRLLPDKSNAIYAPPGFVLFRREETLMALPFDAKTLKATGAAVPVAEQIEFSVRSSGVFSASATGVLVYRRGLGPQQIRLSWLDRSGKAGGAPEVPPAEVWDVRLWPDGKRALLSIFRQESGHTDLWSYDLERGVRNRLTSGTGGSEPVLSPDGRRVAFALGAFGGASSFYVIDSSGEGKPVLLSTFPREVAPLDWSSDGRWILLRQMAGPKGPDARPELWVWSVADKKASAYLQTEWRNETGVFSPDGRWVAYVSNESGVRDVSVRPFPGPGERIQISKGGGSAPRWSRDGSEIAFQAPGSKLMVVEVKTQGGFRAGQPRVLLNLPASTQFWDITADHQRILVALTAVEQKTPTPLSVVTNWTASLPR